MQKQVSRRKGEGWEWLLQNQAARRPISGEKWKKSIRIRIIHSDLNSGYHDPFLRYWIKIYDLSVPACDPTHPGYLAQVFVDTDANWNTISRALFEQLIERGLVSEFVKGTESGVRINLVGVQTLVISGDREKIKVDVATNMGIKTSIQVFLLLEHDSEPLVMESHGIHR